MPGVAGYAMSQNRAGPGRLLYMIEEPPSLFIDGLDCPEALPCETLLPQGILEEHSPPIGKVHIRALLFEPFDQLREFGIHADTRENTCFRFLLCHDVSVLD